MSTIYPKYRLNREAPLEVDKPNENFREYVQEINGNLSEDNFIRGAFGSTSVSVDTFGRFHRAFDYQPLRCRAAGNDPLHTPTYERVPVGNKGQPTKIAKNGGWTTVEIITFNSRNCVLWALASWQQAWEWDGTEERFIGPQKLMDEVRPTRCPGVQYCLSLDGARIAETTIGGLDLSADPGGEAYAQYMNPFVADFVLPISAGKHILRLEARTARPFPYGRPVPADFHYTVMSRELILLEMT